MSIAFSDVGRGAPVVFVHTGFWSFVWRDVVERMRGEYRCICVDAPGTGRSASVPVELARLDRSARAIVGVIDQLDLSGVTLVMHDLGGVAGLAAAARRSSRIARLVAINSFAWKPEGALRTMLALMGSRVMTGFDVLTKLVPRITATGFGVGRHWDPALRDAARKSLDGRALRVFHRYMGDARRADRLYEEIDAALRGPLGRLPLLTIFGERNDPFHFQAGWKQRFPDAWQVVVPGGNHFPMCDDPDLVARTLDAFYRASFEA
ncbi:MAG TPA: alpha/beta hydrolase [Thermoanaerobaculia bacterium]|nr:alpha/beta hydrolase [Thermoanaerobaculia bacterium]